MRLSFTSFARVEGSLWSSFAIARKDLLSSSPACRATRSSSVRCLPFPLISLLMVPSFPIADRTLVKYRSDMADGCRTYFCTSVEFTFSFDQREFSAHFSLPARMKMRFSCYDKKKLTDGTTGGSLWIKQDRPRRRRSPRGF